MAEYIDKAVVLDRFCKVVALYEKVDDCSAEIMKQAQRIVREIPAADVAEVRHGKWMRLDAYKGIEQFKCSECHSECYVPTCMGEPMYAYCPNCSAQMDGGADNEM